MEEYASARLVELVRRALAAEGVDVAVPTRGGALLPLEEKHRFLADVAREHGLMPLLRAGSTLSGVPADPAVSALLKAVTPLDLFERWQRLERFTHSRHRVAVRESGAAYLVVEHVGPPGAPPGPAEDALVLGVLTALLSLWGARGVSVAAGRRAPVAVFADGVFTLPPPLHDSGLWRFAWSGAAVRVENTGNTGETGDTANADGDDAARTRGLLAADPARRWTLRGLAAELGVPARSLQRRLAGAGGFSGLLGTVRTEAAAELLLRGDHAVSVVGFACGYADQPHFTRCFKLRTAMTPAAYRSAFRRPAPDEPRGRTPISTKSTKRRTP